jgi:hypothetical protein
MHKKSHSEHAEKHHEEKMMPKKKHHESKKEHHGLKAKVGHAKKHK